MGAWGTGILQDDTVLDIIEEFKDYLKQTQDIKKTKSLIIENNQEIIEDEDDGPLLWIALAKCLWDYGSLDEEVYKKVVSDFKSEKGLDRWKEESDNDYIKRKKIISEFIEIISIPNPKVKKLPKLVIRKPVFETGDCLSLKVDEKHYGAAIVAKTDNTNIEYGSNLIIVLDYWDINEPKLGDFLILKPLKLTFAKWDGRVHKAWCCKSGFKEYKNRYNKIGNVDVSRFVEEDSKSYSSWSGILAPIKYQYEGYNPEDPTLL